MAQEHILIENWQSHNLMSAVKKLKNNSYPSEDNFCSLIECNLHIVCKNIFDSEYISHIREFSIDNGCNRKLSVDFFIATKKHHILVECKTPNKGKGISPIDQVMKYILMCEANNIKIDRYVIFTTNLNRYDHALIKRFNLPIEEYFITNEKVFTINN